MFDFLHEIMSTIRKNKMRTFLTGFSVAWGIFMLIILLAAGNGMRNGVMSNFAAKTTNSVSIWPGRMSVPHGGYKAGRRIRLDTRDINLLKKYLPNLEHISPFISRSGTISYEKEYGSWSLWGVSQDEILIYPYVKIINNGGRFLNRLDIENRRKVIVISSNMKKELFHDEDPLGKYVTANNLAYQIVGIYDDDSPYGAAYIPYSTAQMVFSNGWQLNGIEMTVTGLNTKEKNEAFNVYLRELLALHHNFSPTDRSALYINNTSEHVLQFNAVFTMINLFILIIGLASLMAGIVGVGNIMLITVKERTREIGIRKAIGASPNSILKLIIFESIFITTIAGYIGILFGIGITEFIASTFFSETTSGNEEVTVFLDPTVDLGTVIGATVFLIACGVFAGMIPALKATRVRPIEAMRAD